MLKGKRRIGIIVLSLFCLGLLAGCAASAGASAEAKLELAIKYLSENKYEEAILAYQEVIKIDAKIVEAYKGISLAYSLQGEIDKAEEILTQGLVSNTDNKYLKLALAGVLIDADKGEEAEKIYAELIQKDKNDLQTYQAYSKYLMNNNRATELIDKIQTLAQNNKENYQIHSLLAELYSQTGQGELALTAITASLKLQADQAMSYKLLKDLYQNNLPEMLALAQDLIQTGEKESGNLIKLEALYLMGNYQEIIGNYAKDKSSIRIGTVLARAYQELDQADKAKEVLKSLKTTDIKDAGILAYLAETYLQLGDKKQARTIAMQGISLDETAIDNYLVMYESYKDEDEAEARKWLIKYIFGSLYSNDTSIKQLGMIWRLGSQGHNSANFKHAENIIRMHLDGIEKTENMRQELINKGGDASAGWWSYGGTMLINEKTGTAFAFVSTRTNEGRQMEAENFIIQTETGIKEIQIASKYEITSYLLVIKRPKIFAETEIPEEFRTHHKSYLSVYKKGQYSNSKEYSGCLTFFAEDNAIEKYLRSEANCNVEVIYID